MDEEELARWLQNEVTSVPGRSPSEAYGTANAKARKLGVTPQQIGSAWDTVVQRMQSRPEDAMKNMMPAEPPRSDVRSLVTNYANGGRVTEQYGEPQPDRYQVKVGQAQLEDMPRWEVNTGLAQLEEVPRYRVKVGEPVMEYDAQRSQKTNESELDKLIRQIRHMESGIPR